MRRFPVFTLVITLSALPHTACAQQAKKSEIQTISQPTNNTVAYLSSLKLPASLSFCDEAVPLEIAEVRERAEREFFVSLQQASQLILNIKRANRYFPLFSKIFREENVPDDLKYLAVAESALYMARSSRDAVGIWQFVDATARRYGLQIDESVDERRHVEKSTRAAVMLLKDGFKRFGSWSMAAASYNMGIEGAQFNVDLQGTNKYYDLYFNEETSRYVLRIAIWKDIIEHARSYGVNLDSSELYKADQTRVLYVRHAIDNLSEWAKENGSSYKDVKLLNPWILKYSLPKPKSGPWEILIRK